MINNKLIAIDFDDTIADYHMKPIKWSIQAIKRIRELWYIPYIFTANKNFTAIAQWLKEHWIDNIVVTNKKTHAKYYIDDRAIHFTNWDNVINKISDIENHN